MIWFLLSPRTKHEKKKLRRRREGLKLCSAMLFLRRLSSRCLCSVLRRRTQKNLLFSVLGEISQWISSFDMKEFCASSAARFNNMKQKKSVISGACSCECFIWSFSLFFPSLMLRDFGCFGFFGCCCRCCFGCALAAATTHWYREEIDCLLFVAPSRAQLPRGWERERV